MSRIGGDNGQTENAPGVAKTYTLHFSSLDRWRCNNPFPITSIFRLPSLSYVGASTIMAKMNQTNWIFDKLIYEEPIFKEKPTWNEQFYLRLT